MFFFSVIVSEVATKKSEFSSFIKEGSISPLIEALKKKIKNFSRRN